MDYKDIANQLRKWANGDTCEDCPAKDDLAFCAADAIRELLSKVEELEARNKRLEEARENANAACAKWEGLYRAELEKKSAWVSVRDRLPEKGEYVLVYANTKYINSKKVCIDRLEDGEKTAVWMYTHGWFEVTHWMPLPEPPKEE